MGRDFVCLLQWCCSWILKLGFENMTSNSSQFWGWLGFWFCNSEFKKLKLNPIALFWINKCNEFPIICQDFCLWVNYEPRTVHVKISRKTMTTELLEVLSNTGKWYFVNWRFCMNCEVTGILYQTDLGSKVDLIDPYTVFHISFVLMWNSSRSWWLFQWDLLLTDSWISPSD